MKEERFSSRTPSKNKISNFGAISPLYPNFIGPYSSAEKEYMKKKEKKNFWIVLPSEGITLKILKHILRSWRFNDE